LTHVQEEQIGRIPDQTRRDKISGIPRTVIPTGAVVWGYSNWDESKFDQGAGPATVEDVFGGDPRDVPDALIAATLSDADVLVTEDKHLRKRVEVKAPGRVWSFEDFYYPTVYDPNETSAMGLTGSFPKLLKASSSMLSHVPLALTHQ
jgi:hypothetical protein